MMASRLLGTLGVIISLCAAQVSLAQSVTTDAAVMAAAEALGMVRGPARRTDSINTVQFSGNGMTRILGVDGEWTSAELTNATVGISYSIPAMRLDLEQVAADGEALRTILVVRDDRAWKERLPGVDPVPVENQVDELLRQIWLTPHGIIRAATGNPGAVGVGSDMGQTMLTVEIDGQSYRTVLDSNYRPVRVETTIEHPRLGTTLHTAIYSNYIDWPILDVYFPARIVQTLGDETTLDMTVTEFYQNPYVVFPTLELLNRSSQ